LIKWLKNLIRNEKALALKYMTKVLIESSDEYSAELEGERMRNIGKQNKILETNKMTWSIIDEDHIKVSFHGAFDERHARIESDLKGAGAHAIRCTYDYKAGKTHVIYKRGK
jgi:hypothetical protein